LVFEGIEIFRDSGIPTEFGGGGEVINTCPVAEDKISSNRNPSLEARRIRRLAYSRLRYFEMTKRNFMREVAWLLISDPNAESAGRWGFQGDFGHNDPGKAHLPAWKSAVSETGGESARPPLPFPKKTSV
jgi:hypothetical protein